MQSSNQTDCFETCTLDRPSTNWHSSAPNEIQDVSNVARLLSYWRLSNPNDTPEKLTLNRQLSFRNLSKSNDTSDISIPDTHSQDCQLMSSIRSEARFHSFIYDDIPDDIYDDGTTIFVSNLLPEFFLHSRRHTLSLSNGLRRLPNIFPIRIVCFTHGNVTLDFQYELGTFLSEYKTQFSGAMKKNLCKFVSRCSKSLKYNENITKAVKSDMLKLVRFVANSLINDDVIDVEIIETGSLFHNLRVGLPIEGDVMLNIKLKEKPNCSVCDLSKGASCRHIKLNEKIAAKESSGKWSTGFMTPVKHLHTKPSLVTLTLPKHM